MSPKERLRDAASRLAGRAEYIEEIADESFNGTAQGGQGELGKRLLTEALGEAKEHIAEIEKIIR